MHDESPIIDRLQRIGGARGDKLDRSGGSPTECAPVAQAGGVGEVVVAPGREPNGDLGAVATIVLADDHPIVRSGLRRLLDREAALKVVAEAGDVEQTVRNVHGYKPNVLVLALNLPGNSSLAVIPAVREASPGTAIVVLTAQDEPAFARAALRAGALGFVLKEASDTELVEAIHAAVRGHRYLDPQLGVRMAVGQPETIARAPDHLTDRELEVLKLIALGYTSTEIAHTLDLSVRTVESHRSHIHHKVRHGSRAELFAYAREHRLID